MKHKSNLTTAEFAKLCRTTKDTLFLYDRKGILKPAQTGENGYRYYSPYQVFDFDTIHMFKQTGSSLKEIQECRTGQDPSFFRQFFEQKIAVCDAQMMELIRSRQKAERLLALLEYAFSRPIGEPVLLDLPEQTLLTTPLQPGDSWDGGPPQAFLDHLAACDAEPSVHREPIGTIYPSCGLRENLPDELCYFASAPRWLESKQIHLKPAGKYVSFLFQGWSTFRETCNRALDFMDAHGLQLGPYVYEFDLVDFMTPEPDHDIIEMQIIVE